MITFLYAGILGLLYAVLTFYTIAGRVQHRISIGDGGNEDMKRRIRVHGNFSEYVPFILILMALYETMNAADTTILHIAGITLILSRTIFSVSVLKKIKIPYGRQIGMVLTLLLLITLSVIGISSGI